MGHTCSDWLLLQSKSDDKSSGVLVWKQRVKLAWDVVVGLNYLHNYISPPCIHKNLKSSNVRACINHPLDLAYSLAQTNA